MLFKDIDWNDNKKYHIDSHAESIWYYDENNKMVFIKIPEKLRKLFNEYAQDRMDYDPFLDN